ncbi:unnamed protein product [Symbiodinium necroappetens]|uniref:Uncharacterized protein n=1 Tax=Symbiodinium necroappetens TaxID=1628268 RepID=A0A812PQ14_9DINO|nr:unnamed protein product [Symbiodinium necroappetens]
MPSSACCCFSWMFSLADARVSHGAGVRRPRRFGGSAFGEGKQARIEPIWDGGYGNETDADYLLEEEQPHLQALVNLKTLEGDWILNKAKSEPLDPLLSVMDICWHPALPTRCDPPECTEYSISMMRQTFTPVRMGQPMYAVIPLDGSVVRQPGSPCFPVKRIWHKRLFVSSVFLRSRAMAARANAELEQRMQRLEELLHFSTQSVDDDVAHMQQELKLLQGRLFTLEQQLALDFSSPQTPREEEPEEVAKPAAELAETSRPSKNRKSVVSQARLQHSLQDSFWDALFVMGLDEIGSLGSLMICIGFCLCFGMQLLFCWVVYASFLDNDPKYDLQYLKEWRVMYGHGVASYDVASGSSLVSKVCEGKAFEQDWWNNNLLGEIDRYLMPLFDTVLPNLGVGVVLSSLAISVWACHVAAELQYVGRLGVALHRLPRGETLVARMREGERTFQSISCCRLAVLHVVLFCRMFVAILLGVSGALWLCKTRDTSEIFLNAVALDFVLEVDDVLFRVLAPRRRLLYMKSIRPLDLGTRKMWHGVDAQCVLKLIALVTTVWLFVSTTLQNNADEARQARDMLCGGNRDFIYGTHPTLGPMFVMDTKNFSMSGSSSMLSGMRPLVTDVVFSYQKDEVAHRMWRSSINGGSIAIKHTLDFEDLQAWLTKSDTEAPEETGMGSRSYGTRCEDRGNGTDFWEADWLWPTVKALTNQRASDCQTALPFCDRRDLPLVRMLCPQTCGCISPASGLYADNGCRQQCQQEDLFQTGLNSTECEDLQSNDPRRESWNRWWNGFYDYNLVEWGTANLMMQFADQGAEGNCSFVGSMDWIVSTACMHNQRRPASMFCPQTCGCTAPNPSPELWCPRTC